ncbi:unnamed protein product [Pocillopora meandrina]|uniref:Ig-like domain-containing protein n=1 Tax=Pocillopora meandrina TaxID=46732 RepID=A0AAU9XV72_9CNID|nr:unnamed protein product [Pocillopora meandrina]
MIRHFKFICVCIFLIPQPTDGGSVTWYEPSPERTTSNTAEVLPPGIVQVYEGSSATLNWNFNVSVGLGLGFVIKFNAVGIISIRADGSASGPIRAEFQKRFNARASPQSASLSISPVTIADDKSNGEFSCELSDANGDTWKRAIQVHVIVPINGAGITGDATVLEGKNLQLSCETSSQIEPNITWTKEKPGKQGNTSVVQEGKVLTIKNIDRSDAGTFTCTAYNGFGEPENQMVYVDVTYPVTIVKFQTEYLVDVQENVTLNCEAEGNPPPTYTWTPCNDLTQVCSTNTLNISQVLNDASYICRVANLHGDDSKTANVYIGGNVIYITIVITSEISGDEKYNQSSLLEKLKKPLREAFADKLGYEGVQLIGVRFGSIIVDLALKFNSTTKEKDVLIILNNVAKDGKLGEFSVGAIKGTRPDVEPTSKGTPTPTDDPSGGKKVTVHCREADNQYAAAGPNVNYRASNPSSEPSVTYEVANRSFEGRRGNKAGAPGEQLPEYAVVDKTKKKKKTPKPGELQYAELGELTGRGQKATMPRVSGTDTVYADIKS